MKFHREELEEAERRLIALICDESKVGPETADQYYLLVCQQAVAKAKREVGAAPRGGRRMSDNG